PLERARLLRLPLLGDLVLLERAARVEEPVEEPLLALRRLRGEAPLRELARELGGLAGELLQIPERALGPRLVGELAEAVRHRLLSLRELLRLLGHRLTAELHGKDLPRLVREIPLLLRELLQRVTHLLLAGRVAALASLGHGLGALDRHEREPV